MRKVLGLVGLIVCSTFGQLNAHCQLPCGIYHDEMVFDEIDQYVETMYKAVSVLNENKFDSTTEKNQFIRWIINKEEMSDGIANRFTQYFLQQKIKPGESDTDKKVIAVHKMLFLLVAIKQNVNLDMVKEFGQEWRKFKLMFHGPNYECETRKLRWELEMEKEAKEKETNKAEKPADQDIKTMVPQPPKQK